MSKKAPSTAQLLVIVGFALSCFGILLFLWVTFGGPTPFRAESYRIKVPFTEATQLAEQSDVRISGVNVGKVQRIDLAPDGKHALATIDIDNKYGPLPASTRAILRTKTLLGETYVELTPGSKEGPRLADGGTLPPARVAESVQLDEIFRTFDPQMRAAFQTWMQEAAVAINQQGASLSYAIGQFEPTFAEFDRLLRTLDSQRLAIGRLFRDGAKTFRALRGRGGELAELIRASNEVFTTAGRRNRDIEALFRAFPTFLDESRVTTKRLKGFARNATPLMRQLVPAAEELSPTLVTISKLAPEAKGFFRGLEPVIDRAPKGFSALRKLFRDQFPPLLRATDPFLRNLNPLLTGLRLYRAELTSFFANIAAATAGFLPTSEEGKQVRPIRVIGGIQPDQLATYPTRLTTSRTSPYSPPRWSELLKGGSLPAFDTRNCAAGSTATLDPSTPDDPQFQARVRPTGNTNREQMSLEFFELLKKYAFGGGSGTGDAPNPPCVQQAPFKPIYGGGPATTYQHTLEQPRR